SVPQTIESDVSFARPYIFTEGSNSVQVTSPDGQSRQKMQFYSTPGTGTIRARLRLVLSLDTDNTDLDLHVVTPDGEH
ncbi:YfaP family protein, partial [Escherichia coli]